MIIGIDPGKLGAIAILHDDLSYGNVFDIPTIATQNEKLQVNPYELAKILLSVEPVKMVYVESVHAMPDQGVVSMFNFGFSYGIAVGVCAGLFLPMRYIRPGVWKKKAGIPTGKKNKDYARTIAQQLYPEAPLAQKKDIGRAEALLIARYGGE